MAVRILALGSRGDVEPAAALAAALHADGVDASVIALAGYRDLVTSLGASFTPIAGDIADAVTQTRTPIGRLVLTGQAGQALILRRWVAEIAEHLADAVLEAVRPGDCLLTGVLTREAASALVQARGCRMATLVFTAMLPTVYPESHCFPGYFTGWAPYDSRGARFGWVIASTLGRPAAREIRQRLSLPPPGTRSAATAEADAHPIIVAASPTLVPPAPDWGPTVHQTGTIVTPEAPFEPSAALADVLDAAAEPPVFVGFGSMAGGLGHHTHAVTVEAARRCGRQLITPAFPGAAPGPVGEGVLAIGQTPHDWLFLRMAAVIHHGGAGTTFSGLRSGMPTAAVPFGVDQPFHARRLHQLGVGPAPLPIRRLTGARLAGLIDELTNSPRSPGYRSRAAELGVTCRAEDGLGATLQLLQHLGWR